MVLTTAKIDTPVLNSPIWLLSIYRFAVPILSQVMRLMTETRLIFMFLNFDLVKFDYLVICQTIARCMINRVDSYQTDLV